MELNDLKLSLKNWSDKKVLFLFYHIEFHPKICWLGIFLLKNLKFFSEGF